MMLIHTVAAGGGSILHFDGSRLTVGPDSADADPGPACYGNGGPLTITDCNVMLGKLQPELFPHVFGPGGDGPLDAARTSRLFSELSDQIEKDTRRPRPLRPSRTAFSRSPCRTWRTPSKRSLSSAATTSRSTRLDFSCALFDANGELIANAPHMPVHLGSMSESIKSIIRDRGNSEGMSPGDAYVMNAPYNGGTHLPDITVIKPVFGEDGRSVIFYVASRGHHADIGGSTPDSAPQDSTTGDEEGVLMDNVTLVSGGRFLEDIVNMASSPGIMGGPGMTAYSASKGAVTAFTRAAAAELAPYNIRVNCIAPGWVDTPFNEPAISYMGGSQKQFEMVTQSVPLARQAVPEEIAQGYLYLCDETSASYVTGQVLTIDGGML